MGSLLQKQPKVSVLLATYNSAGYLPEAINSILTQSLQDFELIIIDDGSTDKTMDVLNSCQDHRIIIIRNTNNIGQTASLNRAISERHLGGYIARVDADDIAEPTMLEAMTSYLDSHPEVGVIGSAKIFIDHQGNTLRSWCPPLDNKSIQQTLLEWNCIPHGGAVYKREALLETGGYQEKLKYAQDYDLALHLTEHWDAVNLPQLLYRYRWHDRMVSLAKRENQDKYAQIAVHDAINRRLHWGWSCLGLVRSSKPDWMHQKTDCWIANRYAWWSSGVRVHNKRIAVQFLMIALLIKPASPENWMLINKVIHNKTTRLINRSKSFLKN